MQIKAYLKPSCGWSRGVRSMFSKYQIEYEDLDIVNNRETYEEMVRKSGQPLSPCVEVDGVMLADVSGEEVENYLVANGLVERNAADTEYPINQACGAHRREDPQTVRFF